MIRNAAADAVAAARGKQVVYSCHWINCGGVLQSQEALGEHVMREHIHTTALQCGWVGCTAPVFSTRGRLAIHFNETHLQSCRQELTVSAAVALQATRPTMQTTAAPMRTAAAAAAAAAGVREAPPRPFFSKAYLRYLARSEHSTTTAAASAVGGAGAGAGAGAGVVENGGSEVVVISSAPPSQQQHQQQQQAASNTNSGLNMLIEALSSMVSKDLDGMSQMLAELESVW